MPSYDFRSLSPYDLELLVRDLFQAELGITLESFKPGKDQGVDLRYARDPNGHHIVQCKHFVESSFSRLLRHLESDERPKVMRLNPTRYYLATSAALTKLQKDKVFECLAPFCQSPGDVFGQSDLNNLLGKFSDVEKRHFKLWLTSTAVMERIVHSGLYSRSEAERARLTTRLKYYVQNQSFFEAIKILEDMHYCIVTGIPGIGKTTLAEILIVEYLSQGYELISIEGDIREASDAHKPGKRQLFYYDDFLGQYSIGPVLGKNEDRSLLRFIETVRGSATARFVMTTRDYTLNQAKASYERLSSSKFDYRRCVIDLSKYTRYDRARILFNHLYYSRIPNEFKDAVVKSGDYWKIIRHPNYSPRIIDAMTDEQMRPTDCTAGAYVNAFIANLDNPIRIWEHAFEQSLSARARDLLLVLASFPEEILAEDLQRALASFSAARGENMTGGTLEKECRDALRTLEGTFIAVEPNERRPLVGFQNPSVRDFLDHYLATHPGAVEAIASGIVFFEQWVKLWGRDIRDVPPPKTRAILKRRIDAVLAISQHSINLPTARLITFRDTPQNSWKVRWPQSTEDRVRFSLNVAADVGGHEAGRLATSMLAFVSTRLRQNESDCDDVVGLLKELLNLRQSFPNVAGPFAKEALEYLLRTLQKFDDFESLLDLQAEYPDIIPLASGEALRSRFENVYIHEADSVLSNDDPSWVTDCSEKLERLGKVFDVDVDSQIDQLRVRVEELELKAEKGHGEEPVHDWSEVLDEEKEQEAEIDALFSLLTDSSDSVEEESNG